eukprot:UN11105
MSYALGQDRHFLGGNFFHFAEVSFKKGLKKSKLLVRLRIPTPLRIPPFEFHRIVEKGGILNDISG